MRESAISRYLGQQHYEVFDMLHILHPYEKKILDGPIFGIDMSTEGSLLSLERTKTTICHRDITFRNVPGLQFVVRRERRIPDAAVDRDPEIRRLVPQEFRGHGGFPLPRVSSAGRRGAPSQSYNIDVVDGWHRSRRRHSRRHSSRAAIESDEVSSPRRYALPALDIRRARVSSDSEDQGYSDIEAELDSMSLPEQDEDTVIDDMLKRYTTVFD